MRTSTCSHSDSPRRNFSTSSRSAAFSLSFIFCMNSENCRISPAILSAISFAPLEVFSACVCDVQPFVRGGVDLRGELFEVLDFFADGAERAGFNHFDNRAVIQNERHRAEHRAERDARRGGDDFPAANRMRRVLDEKIRRREQQRVAEQKRPLGNRPVFRVVHAASFGKNHEAQARRRLAMASSA